MRRVFHIILSFSLMVATTGLSISKHYCGNSVVHTTLGTEAKSCMPGMDMGHGCCDEETETHIVEDDFQISHSDIHLNPEYDLLISYLVTVVNLAPEFNPTSHYIAFDTGPPVPDEPLYVMVQSFLL